MSNPDTQMGQGMVKLRRYLRWANGSNISEAFWNEVIAEVEQDARKKYALAILNDMKGGTGDHGELDYLLFRLYDEATK